MSILLIKNYKYIFVNDIIHGITFYYNENY